MLLLFIFQVCNVTHCALADAEYVSKIFAKMNAEITIFACNKDATPNFEKIYCVNNNLFYVGKVDYMFHSYMTYIYIYTECVCII